MLRLSDKNKYYLASDDFLATLKHFFLSQFPDCECEVSDSLPKCSLPFDEDFFAAALVKTLRSYMPAVPTKIAFDFENGKFIFKIVYPKAKIKDTRPKSESVKAFLLNKCSFEALEDDNLYTLKIKMTPEESKSLRVYANSQEKLYSSLIKALRQE